MFSHNTKIKDIPIKNTPPLMLIALILLFVVDEYKWEYIFIENKSNEIIKDPVIKKTPWKPLVIKVFYIFNYYSHSIVAGGLEEISYVNLLIPLTSFMILLETLSKNSYGNLDHVAVIKSIVLADLKTAVYS